MEIKNTMYFKTYDNEYLKIERFMGDTFQIFSRNYPTSFSTCREHEIHTQVKKGIWIELDKSEYPRN